MGIEGEIPPEETGGKPKHEDQTGMESTPTPKESKGKRKREDQEGMECTPTPEGVSTKSEEPKQENTNRFSAPTSEGVSTKSEEEPKQEDTENVKDRLIDLEKQIATMKFLINGIPAMQMELNRTQMELNRTQRELTRIPALEMDILELKLQVSNLPILEENVRDLMRDLEVRKYYLEFGDHCNRVERSILKRSTHDLSYQEACILLFKEHERSNWDPIHYWNMPHYKKLEGTFFYCSREFLILDFQRLSILHASINSSSS